jgi:uncharacterized phage protein (TIGR01671 family)
MREIKFRAWDKNKKIMSPVWGIGWKGWQGIEESEINYVELEDNGVYDVSEIECVLMQFTGMLDKNGKEIYDGDILKVYFHYDGDYFTKEQLCAVVFEEAEFYGKPFKNKGIQNSFYEALNQKEIIEIIGNIHENPELLK